MTIVNDNQTYFFNGDLTLRKRSALYQSLLPVFTGMNKLKPTSPKWDKDLNVFMVLMANFVSANSCKTDSVIIRLRKEVLDRKWRYRNPDVTYDRIKRTIGVLANLGLIIVEKGSHYRYDDQGNCLGRSATRLNLTPSLLSLIKNATSADVKFIETAEVVMLKAYKPASSFERMSELVDYADEDDRSVPIMRSQVRKINTNLKHHPVVYTGDLPVNLANTRLRRYFIRNENEPKAFSLGGRLFGHFAQYLPKAERRYLTVDGEPLADLDYGTMHLRLLYAKQSRETGVAVDQECLKGDPFNISGLPEERDFFKQMSYVVLNCSKPLRDFPKDPSLRGMIPERYRRRFKAFEQELFEALPIVKKYAYTGVGLELMKAESDILIDVLLLLCDNRIGFVPMHDGIMVSDSAKAITEEAMILAFTKHTNLTPLIKDKTSSYREFVNIPPYIPPDWSSVAKVFYERWGEFPYDYCWEELLRDFAVERRLNAPR